MSGKAKDHGSDHADAAARLPKKLYETELYRLQGELVRMQATGHCPNLSAPDETIAAIKAFL